MSAAAVLLVSCLCESSFAYSKTRVLLNLTLYGQIDYETLIDQAQSMVSQEIVRQFSRDANLSEIEVVVLGDRNGDVIPLLTTSVPRSQWRVAPQVEAWTEFNLSYILFRQHDMHLTQAVAAASPPPTIIAQDTSTQFDHQYDVGRLLGQAVQEDLDILD